MNDQKNHLKKLKKNPASQAGVPGSTTALIYFLLSCNIYDFCTESNSDIHNFISRSNLTSQILVFPQGSQIRSRQHKYYMFSWGNPLFLFHGLVLEAQIRCRNPRVFFAISSNPSNSVLEEVANKSNSFLCNLKLFSGYWFHKILCFCFVCVYLEGNTGEDLERIAAQEQKILPYETLAAATRNFHPHHRLGEGGFGPVFRVRLITDLIHCFLFGC